MYAIYGIMDPINISPMLAYIPAPMDPMGMGPHFRTPPNCSKASDLSVMKKGDEHDETWGLNMIS